MPLGYLHALKGAIDPKEFAYSKWIHAIRRCCYIRRMWLLQLNVSSSFLHSFRLTISYIWPTQVANIYTSGGDGYRYIRYVTANVFNRLCRSKEKVVTYSMQAMLLPRFLARIINEAATFTVSLVHVGKIQNMWPAILYALAGFIKINSSGFAAAFKIASAV